jgi:glycosyltransferase involved in cell wall biosynthesis
VCTPVGGLPGVVRNGVEGFWVERDAVSFCHALRRLCTNRQIVQTMSTAARSRFASHFVVHHMALGYEAAYERAAATVGAKALWC